MEKQQTVKMTSLPWELQSVQSRAILDQEVLNRLWDSKDKHT